MADVSGVDNLTSSSNGSTSLTGIKAAIDNLNSAKAESSAVVPNTRTVAGHALSADVTLVKGDVGLGNVDNTSDATKNSASVTLTNKTIAGGSNTITGITEAMQTLADNTTGNVSTSAHGYAPKAPNDSTKYLDGTGAFSVPSGTLPKMRLASSFETAARFTTANNANTGAASFGNTGLSITTGATASSYVQEIYLASGPTATGVYAAGGIFSALLSVGATGTTADSFFGLGQPTVAGSGHTFTAAHIGFKLVISGSTATLYATTGDGSSETAVSLGTFVTNDMVDLICQIVSTSSVNFYTRKNGGALSAATNISTHIPTAAESRIQFSISNQATATSTTLTFGGMCFER